MRSLSAHEGLRLLELDQALSPVDKAMALLGLACPEMTRNELLGLPIGKRDALLLTLREATFGSTLTARADCPQCAETLEFRLDVASLLDRGTSDRPTKLEETFAAQGLTFRFRLPDSTDLTDATECADVESARARLIDRCVQSVRKGSNEISLTDVPEATMVALSEFFGQLDPLSELRLALTCPGCGHEWNALFDPAEFLWEELRDQASRLLQEIDALARAYGWREEDVLSMTPARRRLYVGMVTQ
jgi:hypothetical protein